MDNKDIHDLLRKFREGTIDKEEKAFLENWVLFGEFTERELSDVELDRELNKVGRGLPLERTIRLWPRIAAAAAILLVVAAGVLLYTNKANQVVQTAAYSNDVVPGSVGATLTLASGKRIVLSDAVKGELANEAGLSISKTADGQIVYETKHQNNTKVDQLNTLSTAKGETYTVRLSDGSLVVLNAASSLTYTANLNEHGKRVVKLEGEAYFEVSKNKKMPFIVESSGQRVEVLGTHFNISAYKDETEIKTTLLEGSVRVAFSSLPGGDGDRAVILKPNQQAVLSGSKGLNVKVVDVSEAISWKEGYFRFNSTPLEGVMKQIARWYNVEVIYEKPELKGELMGGSVSRYDKVSGILKALENTGAVKFKIEGRKVYVTK